MRAEIFSFDNYTVYFNFFANRQRHREIRVYPDFDPVTLKMSALRIITCILTLYI